jgi:cell wall-associated NlpC family hydrolase
MERDFSRYVGIPYVDKGTDPAHGLDCWQLVRHFYAQELGRTLPDYLTFYDSSLDARDVGEAMLRASPQWEPINPPPRFGDLLVFRILSGPWHCGVCLDDGVMLHTDQGHGSVIEPSASLRWRHRLYGVYRWKS